MALTDSDKKKIQELKQKGYSLDEVKAHFGARKGKRFSTIDDDLRQEVEATQQATRQEVSDKGIGQQVAEFGAKIVGGGELARGLALGIAAPDVLENISKAEQMASDVDLQLIKAIGNAQQEGNTEVVENLTKVRERHLEDMKATGNVREEFIASLPSNKAVIGSAVRLAGTLAAPTIAGKATAGFQAAQPTAGILSSAATGAKVGAIGGAIEGGVQGAGMAMEEDKSAAEVLYGTVGGATMGALAGGAVGGVLGGVSGLIGSRKMAEEAARQSDKLKQSALPAGVSTSDFAEDFVTPKLTGKKLDEAIAQGRFVEPKLLEKAKIRASARDKKVAEAARELLDPRATAGQNIANLRDEIGRISNGVDDYVTTNKVPFNKNQLRSRLMAGKDDLDLIFAADTTAEKTYNAVVDEFVDLLDNGDTAGLLQARQDLDSVPAIKKLLQSEGLGENTRKEVVLQVRRQANEYIGDLLPAGNTYKADMMQEHLLFEAVGNASTKLRNVVGKNQIQLLMNQYPSLRYVVGSLPLGAAATAGIASVG